MCKAEDELKLANDDIKELKQTVKSLQRDIRDYENQIDELQADLEYEKDRQTDAEQYLDEDVQMLCARLGISRHDWDLERDSLRNQLLK